MILPCYSTYPYFDIDITYYETGAPGGVTYTWTAAPGGVGGTLQVDVDDDPTCPEAEPIVDSQSFGLYCWIHYAGCKRLKITSSGETCGWQNNVFVSVFDYTVDGEFHTLQGNAYDSGAPCSAARPLELYSGVNPAHFVGHSPVVCPFPNTIRVQVTAGSGDLCLAYSVTIVVEEDI